jgi:molybdopterin-containing oxidoreductase family iron-sulfur binding subunit
MSTDRRTFLGVAGLGALAIAGKASVDALASGGETHAPKAGMRWAMVIDPFKCIKEEGCKACTDACHKVHNVPRLVDKRHEVKWIWKEPYERAFAVETDYTQEALKEKPVLVFCNHCDNPPCVRVCPTQATWKREDGVVAMDWHRCIGCRYCVAACPYGSRSFNWVDPRPGIAEITPEYPTRTKGVVEKCTFCEERLAEGKSPACVEACKEKALVFGNLHDEASEVRARLKDSFTIRRKPELGTEPEIFYVVGGKPDVHV